MGVDDGCVHVCAVVHTSGLSQYVHNGSPPFALVSFVGEESEMKSARERAHGRTRDRASVLGRHSHAPFDIPCA